MANVWSSTRLLEFDYAGIEQVLMGWAMTDPGYIRIAKLGVHANVAAHELNRPADMSWPDDRLAAYFQEIKASEPVTYDRSKRVVHGCVPGDHEVLTPRGWVRFDELSDEPVAQWHPKTRQISFVVPTQVTKRAYEGPLHELFGRGLAIQMTPWHRVPVYSSGKLRERTAETLLSSGRIPIAGMSTGRQSVEAVALFYAVALQADGHINQKHHIFHFTRARKITRLRHLLTELGIQFEDQPCKCHPTGRRFHVLRTQRIKEIETAWFTTLGTRKAFNLTALMRLNLGCRAAFLDETAFWDGHARTDHRCYLTTSYENAVTVQTLTHLTGRQGLLRVKYREGRKPLYSVSFNRRTQARIEMMTHEEVPFHGTVYCVTVPSTYFLVKWKERISITGNTAYGLTTFGMVRTYPKTFPTLKSAEKTQAVYFALAPGVRKFHDVVRHTAHEQHYLGGSASYQYLPDQLKVIGHPYQYKHWLWSVVAYERLSEAQRLWRTKRQMPMTEFNGIWWGVTLGEDAKRAVAFYPQSMARGVLTEACFPLFEAPDHPWYIGEVYYGETPLRAPIHDSLLLEVPTRKVDRVIEAVAGSMQAPCLALPCPEAWGIGPYLTINVEAKIGTDWGAMEKLKVSTGVATDVPYSPAEDGDEEDVADLETEVA